MSALGDPKYVRPLPYLFSLLEILPTMPVTAQIKVISTKRGPSMPLFYLSIFALLGSMSFFFIGFLAPPRDSACVRKNGFTPLQDVIKYRWVNYADFYFPRSAYRTHYNMPTSPEAGRAWQNLLHSLYSPNDCFHSRLLTSYRFRGQYPRISIDTVESND